jgi:anhydro-N-acetylmuramic acid kinase
MPTRGNWLFSLAEGARRDTVLVGGLMSGTSADAVDAALVELAGHGRGTRVREVAFASRLYPPDVRAGLFDLFAGRGSVREVCALNVAVAETFACAALDAMARANLLPSDVLVWGSHGQTVWHTPPSARDGIAGTLQIGSPAVIAARTGIPVVSDFRAADMALGGEGAPLVPYFDWLLLTDRQKSRAVQNIGGIANVTYLPPNATASDVLAFDTGPGNALMDAAVAVLTGGRERFDRDGARASRGTVDPTLLRRWLEHPYFALEPPKSTGRELFGVAFAVERVAEAHSRGLSDDDILATLAALTAESLADAYRRFLVSRGRVDEVIVAGGGAKNPFLMRLFRDALASRGLTPEFRSPEDFGLRAASKEAVAFALLARETVAGVCGNLPSVTGASRPAILGSITPANGAPMPTETSL